MTVRILQKVLANGTRFVVSERGGQTVIQQFWKDGTLAQTKVKKVTKAIVGNKKVYTKDEFRYMGEPHKLIVHFLGDSSVARSSPLTQANKKEPPKDSFY